jgi:radical SAM superfamily enzyme YgiQ (UPF0313 family)
MTNRPLKITLLHHPTVALRISGFSSPDFEVFADSGLYLGNVYRKIMPPSLPRVASVMERDLEAKVEILDLRMAEYTRDEIYRVVDWEGYRAEVTRIGAPFSYADQAILESDWIGITSHFTFESGIIKDLIGYAKTVNPQIKIMVGGADVKARPHDYLSFGADLAFIGDFNPQALRGDNTCQRVEGPYLHSFEELTLPSFDKLQHLNEYTDSHDGTVPEGVQTPIGFIYFTRGCPRECDFCESRRSQFEALHLNTSISMLEHYRESGIKTLNFADDNLLLLAAKKEGRKNLIELFKTMREMGFAWEFPNGLEIGRLLVNKRLDEELLETLFSHGTDSQSGYIVGAYRLYVPVETFNGRDAYRKLKPLQEQNYIIESIVQCGLPEIDFGVVIPPDANEDTFSQTREGYLELKDIITKHGKTKARYAVFHLIPIALFRNMHTKYSVDDFPEGWNFYFPV